VPDTGDVLWLSFGAGFGHEQHGKRPALVVSPALFNRHDLVLVCPITSVAKGYPFEVVIPVGSKTKGVVLVDQLRAVDWRARAAKRTETLPDALVAEVRAKVHLLLGG
jgi:mRNA interferase MazF